MTTLVNRRDAERHFARYVTAAELGEEILIMRRGRPVAKLVPVETQRPSRQERQAALECTRERMHVGYHLGGERVTRDDIYKR